MSMQLVMVSDEAGEVAELVKDRRRAQRRRTTRKVHSKRSRNADIVHTRAETKARKAHKAGKNVLHAGAHHEFKRYAELKSRVH